jgi:hypothetical protein
MGSGRRRRPTFVATRAQRALSLAFLMCAPHRHSKPVNVLGKEAVQGCLYRRPQSVRKWRWLGFGPRCDHDWGASDHPGI